MYLDILIISLLIIYIISGFSIGFFVEFLSTFGLVGNLFLAKYLTPIATKKLEFYMDIENYTVSYAVIFILLYFLLLILTAFLNLFFRTQHKGIMNRLGGALMSGIKGFIISLVLIVGFRILGKHYPGILKYGENSRVIEWSDNVLPTLDSYLPNQIKKQIEELKTENIVNKYLKKIF
ncbi:MAG: CvpA family protein [Fusobacteriaceae bacterium]